MRILIKGTGEIASAVACTLHRAGHRVVLVDGPVPAESRRGMSFTEAVYAGSAELDGLRALRVDSVEAAAGASPETVAVLVAPARELAATFHPDVVVDARMRKWETPEPQIGEAPLVIGLGPGMRVGVIVDLAVETNRGPNEGTVLTEGETEPYTGRVTSAHVPAGVGTRYAHAPAAGLWETSFDLGDSIVEGALLGRVGGEEVRAPVAGSLRGITRAGAWVTPGTRVADVDPWRTPEKSRGVTGHSRTIAEGVLRAIQEYNVVPSSPA